MSSKLIRETGLPLSKRTDLNECIKYGRIVLLDHLVQLGRVASSNGVSEIHTRTVVGVCSSQHSYLTKYAQDFEKSCHIRLLLSSLFGANNNKQNARQLLTPVSFTVFYTLSHGTLSFAFHGSFLNYFLIGQNAPTANQIL